MERVGGNISDLMCDQYYRWIDPHRTTSDRRFALTQLQWSRILEVLNRLDALQLIHGDLKPRNLLYMDLTSSQSPMDWELRLCDFAFSGWVERSRPESRQKGHSFGEPQNGFPNAPFRDRKNNKSLFHPPGYTYEMWASLNRLQWLYAMGVARPSWMISDTGHVEPLTVDALTDRLGLSSSLVQSYLALYQPLHAHSTAATAHG
jgi:serine/threonine protein kinase